jgi:hypothetical protein
MDYFHKVPVILHDNLKQESFQQSSQVHITHDKWAAVFTLTVPTASYADTHSPLS